MREGSELLPNLSEQDQGAIATSPLVDTDANEANALNTDPVPAAGQVDWGKPTSASVELLKSVDKPLPSVEILTQLPMNRPGFAGGHLV